MKFSKFGLLLIIVGSLALFGGCTEDCDTTSQPLDPPVLEYVGSDVCGTCHSEIHNTWTHSGHPYKLTKLDGGPPVGIFPDPSAYDSDSTDPPVGTSWDQFSYTIGGYGWKMRWIQNDGYIYTTGGSNQYNFETGEFTDYHADAETVYDCGACHTTGWVDSDDGNADNNQDGMEGFLGTFVAGGVHCEGCHGMGSRHAYQPKSYAVGKDNSSFFCGKCHTRGGDNGVSPGADIIEASGGFIKHHEQYDEWYNSPHNSANGPGCNTCHDPHASVKFDADAPGDGISKEITCVSCHVDGDHADILVLNHPDVSCTSCHMPDASKSAVANNIYSGDVSTHLWKIRPSINGKADMFTPDLTSVAIGDDGYGALSLDFACYGCHKDENDVGGERSTKTMQELFDRAVIMHTVFNKEVANK